MKNLLKLLCLTLSCVLAVGICVLCVGCSSENSTTADATTYVSMRINPQIEMVADKSGKVIAVNAINEDGETVLTQLELENKTIEEASTLFTEEATKEGYLDIESEDATVYVDVECPEAEKEEKLRDSISKRINQFFDNNGIFGKVSKEDLEEYKEKSVEWNIPLGQVKVVMRILELYPEMSEEEVLALSRQEMFNLIRDNHKNNGICKEVRDEYKTAVEELKEEYKDIATLRDEIRKLHESLRDKTLSEEEKDALQNELKEKLEQEDSLIKEFEEKLKAIKEEYREKSEEKIEIIKNKAEERKEKIAEKIENHLNDFNQNKEKIKKQIQTWRQVGAGFNR